MSGSHLLVFFSEGFQTCGCTGACSLLCLERCTILGVVSTIVAACNGTGPWGKFAASIAIVFRLQLHSRC